MKELFESNEYMTGTVDEIAYGKPEPAPVYQSAKLGYGNPESDRPQVEASPTAVILAECLKTAREAYRLSGENASSEDIRALAITIFIDKGKDKRTERIETKSAPRPTAPQQQTAVTPTAQLVAPQPQGKPKAKFSGDPCPHCGGKLYDNRENKLSPKSPDYKCASCGKAGWNRTNKSTGQKFISWN